MAYPDGVPLTGSNLISTADKASLDIVGDLEIVAYTAATDWTPAAVQTIAGKWITSTSQRSYLFQVNTGGQLRLSLSQAGATGNTTSSSVATGFTDGAAYWKKATFRASDSRVQFFTAAAQASEPGSWTQLGTDQSNVYSSIFSGSAPLSIGGQGDGASAMTGKIYRLIVRAGSSVVADFDSALSGPSGYTDAYGNAWVIS